jgi:hypothetical protein
MNRPILIVFACAASALIGVARAQEPSNPDPACNGKRVSTTGEATVKLDPNEATIDLGVVTQGTTGAEAGRKNATIASAVKKALERFRPQSLSTTGYNMQPNLVYEQNKAPRLINYTVYNTVRVKTAVLDDIGPMVDAAMTAGANQVSGLQFSSNQVASARLDALAKASADAKTRAEAMARGTGAKIGAIVWLSDTSSPPPMPMMKMAAPMMAAESVPTPIEAGTIDVMVSVSLTACLAP